MDKIIGIDVYSALHYPRGMGIYTINIVNELAKIDKETPYILYADVDDTDNVLPKQDNFVFKKLNAKGFFHYEQFVLPRQAKKDKISLLHSPANTSPIFLDKSIKRVLTQHDIIFLKKEIPLPNKKQFLGRLYYVLNAFLNLQRSEIIFTVSEYSKKDISNYFNIDEQKFVIAHNGHEHFNFEKASSLKELQDKYKIPDEYFFTLGGEAPSKNTEILLKIFSKHQEINLVAAGIKKLENSVLYLKYKSFPNITFVPYITQADIAGLYKNAKAFIFPSVYEGFGIPIIEAQKCHCPLFCSDAACLPEIAGDGAVYFNPKNEDDILAKIKNTGTDHLNLSQYKKYSWKTSAEIIHKNYTEIMKQF